MSNKILNKLNTIVAKGYKFFIAIGVIVFVFLSFIIAYIAKQKYTVTSIAVVEPYSNKLPQKVENGDVQQLELIIEKNTKDIVKEELYTEEIDLEFTTVYIKSDKFELGTIQTQQEGRDGKQVITRKKTFVNDELISDKAVGSQILKPAADKIVAIGTKQSVNDSANGSSNSLNFNMNLNKPSGLSLAQFEKIFANNSNDKKGVMKDNAKYFYYAEQQYSVNGIFLASVAIHESNWGTSTMAQNKKNLFGYGAYDRAPSENAYSFGTYEEGIDMLARVFAKYYLNPKGTAIYNGEIASGNYYNGPTLTGVNTKYASDKNWANAVYKWMQYLYNKL
mgnify:CR=1 FL=1